MDKYYFVIGYKSWCEMTVSYDHLTKIVFVTDGEPLIAVLKEIVNKVGGCGDLNCPFVQTCSSGELDEYLLKLHPDGRQEKIYVRLIKNETSFEFRKETEQSLTSEE